MMSWRWLYQLCPNYRERGVKQNVGRLLKVWFICACIDNLLDQLEWPTETDTLTDEAEAASTTAGPFESSAQTGDLVVDNLELILGDNVSRASTEPDDTPVDIATSPSGRMTGIYRSKKHGSDSIQVASGSGGGRKKAERSAPTRPPNSYSFTNDSSIPNPWS